MTIQGVRASQWQHQNDLDRWLRNVPVRVSSSSEKLPFRTYKWLPFWGRLDGMLPLLPFKCNFDKLKLRSLAYELAATWRWPTIAQGTKVNTGIWLCRRWQHYKYRRGYYSAASSNHYVYALQPTAFAPSAFPEHALNATSVLHFWSCNLELYYSAYTTSKRQCCIWAITTHFLKLALNI